MLSHLQLSVAVNSPIDHLTLPDILERTIELAQAAAVMLRGYYQDSGETLNVRDKLEGPVTIADETVDKYLIAGIRGMCGDACGYLTEETHQTSDPELPQDWVWIIDPLDGTRDFIDKTGEYAIHIALTYQHRPVLAVVAIPESHKLYAAVEGGGTILVKDDGTREPVKIRLDRQLPELIVVASRNHRSDRLRRLLALLPCQQYKEVGSIGCKIAAILDGQADLYISLSGRSAPKDWDFAAPELIFTEAGGIFTYQDGSPIKYNRGDVSQWGCLVASNGEWHQEILDYCKTVLAG